MSKKQKIIDIKKIGSRDELEGVCDFIEQNLHHVLSVFKRQIQIKEFSIAIQDFFEVLKVIKTFYFELNSTCQKNITTNLLKVHKTLSQFLKQKTNDKLVEKLLKEQAIVASIITSCIGKMRQSSQDTRTDAEKVSDLMIQIMNKLRVIFQEEIILRNIPETKQPTVRLRIILLKNEPYELATLKRGILFSVMNMFSDHIYNVFTTIAIDDQVKQYILSLLHLWKTNFKKNDRRSDQQLAANCALVILKRVILACSLFLEKKEDVMFMKYMEKLTPTVPELNRMLKTAFEVPQRRPYIQMISRMRSKWQQKMMTERKSIHLSEQQIREWEDNVSRFLQQLDEQNERIQKTQSMTSRSMLQQQLPQQLEQKQQKKQTTRRQSKSPQQLIPFRFQYESPSFHHHKKVMDDRLRQRKDQNIPEVQTSLMNTNLPSQIMKIAMDGHYTGIFLIDVANKRRQFASQQQMRSRLRSLMPMDIPTKARRKPLFVLVEQTDLDQSTIPKARLDDSLLRMGMIQIKVSCVKQTPDGRRIDCYKKETAQDFTKNPMDDFVLLTLRHTLRSYYKQYMKQLGKNINILKKLETFQELLSNNPFQVLMQQEEFGGIVRQSYRNAYFDDRIPYTWLISDDQWRDWTRFSR